MDQQSLIWFHCLQNCTGRLARTAVLIQQCNFNNKYKNEFSTSYHTHYHDYDKDKLVPFALPVYICIWYSSQLAEVRSLPQENPYYKIVGGKLYRQFWDPCGLSETYNEQKLDTSEWPKHCPVSHYASICQECFTTPPIMCGGVLIASRISRRSNEEKVKYDHRELISLRMLSAPIR